MDIYQILAAVVNGLFLVSILIIQQVMLSRKRKTEDVAGAIIPRRAKLYRKLLCSICWTGVQYDYEIGTVDLKKKIVFLHETCNRAMYELSPFGGANTLLTISKLSTICAKHRHGIVNATAEELEQKWQAFKYEFQFDFMTLVPVMRTDCMGAAIEKLIVDSKSFYQVQSLMYPWQPEKK